MMLAFQYTNRSDIDNTPISATNQNFDLSLEREKTLNYLDTKRLL